jgi:acyl carrier protein phosphodiesterase
LADDSDVASGSGTTDPPAPLNYLAHLRLAPAAPLLRLGNLLGDFVRGVDVSSLPPAVREGIAQHRAIDRFTDQHPRFCHSRARLGAPFARVSGVLVDVFYDHFLAREWQRWGDGRTLAQFTGDVYHLLAEQRELLSPQLRAALPHMVAQDWLGSYGDLDAVDLVLGRMARRLRHSTTLGEGGTALRANYDGLQGDFAAFFPEAIAHARTVWSPGS